MWFTEPFRRFPCTAKLFCGSRPTIECFHSRGLGFHVLRPQHFHPYPHSAPSPAKKMVRSCENFILDLALLFCLALFGSCLTKFAHFLAGLCHEKSLTLSAFWCPPSPRVQTSYKEDTNKPQPHHCATHGCQMAIARFFDRMCLALQASGLWLRYATQRNLIPSFPWIAPHALHPGAIQGKEGIKFCHLATLPQLWDVPINALSP